MGIAASGADGNTISSYAQFIFSSGQTQQQSTVVVIFNKKFQSASVVGRRNSISPPAKQYLAVIHKPKTGQYVYAESLQL